MDAQYHLRGASFSLYLYLNMATAIRTVELLSAILGVLPSTLDREIRALRLAGWLPTGQRGGGKGSAHFDAYHYAYILLGLAGLQPSDAPDAVSALNSIPFRGQHPAPEDVGPPLPTLEDMLSYWIRAAGAARRANSNWFPEDEAVLRSWRMQLCLDPRHAIITVSTSIAVPMNAAETTIIYAADPPASQPGVKRLTVISGDVLLKVGELLADTEKHVILTQSLLDQTLAKASPEGESAGHPCHGTPTLSEGQPRTTETSATLPGALDATCEPEGPQGSNTGGLRAGPSFNEFERRATCPSLIPMT